MYREEGGKRGLQGMCCSKERRPGDWSVSRAHESEEDSTRREGRRGLEVLDGKIIKKRSTRTLSRGRQLGHGPWS